MKQVSAPEWKRGLPTRHQEDNKVIRCMIPGQLRPRETTIASCPSHSPVHQVEFVSPRTVQHERRKVRRMDASSEDILLVQEAAILRRHLQWSAILPGHSKSPNREDSWLA
jgi:hypothetical protein